MHSCTYGKQRATLRNWFFPSVMQVPSCWPSCNLLLPGQTVLSTVVLPTIFGKLLIVKYHSLAYSDRLSHPTISLPPFSFDTPILSSLS